MTSDKLKVIYLLGCSRSGSTILDSILGSATNAIGLGELEKLHESGWLGSDYCGCGVKVNDCDFWTGVRRRWARNSDLNSYIRMQSRYCRVRQVPRLLFSRKGSGTAFGDYADSTTSLYNSIAAESGAEVIVDSSKNPIRALALSRLKAIDLRLVHLVRDPRGVATSLMKSWKKDPRAGIQDELSSLSVKQVARGWNLSNLLSEWMTKRCTQNAIRIRYEDFLEEPTECLKMIGDKFSMDLEAVTRDIELGHSIEIGHTVAGNRLRMNKSVRLRKRDEWADHIADDVDLEIRRRCGRRMASYGYVDAKK